MKDWQRLAVAPTASIREVIAAIDSGGARIVLVVEAGGKLVGTITDGDVRRGLLRGVGIDMPASEIMQRQFKSVSERDDRDSVLAALRRFRVQQMPILDERGIVIGLQTLEELVEPAKRSNWVVLMAGGLGQRLRPLTDERPKPMLQIGNRPLLETIIEQFANQGFVNIFIAINYLGQQIREHFGDGRRWDVSIRYLDEVTRLGTAGALSLLPHPPTEPVIVMNGDILTRVDFVRLLEFHQANRSLATMALREHVQRIPYGVVQFDDVLLTSIQEKPAVRHFVSAGVYALEPQAVAAIPHGVPYDMPQLFNTIIDQGARAAVFPVHEYWIDIGKLEDFERANRDFDGHFE
jgi:dTDP-glucose pyrophosphorylase